MKRSITFLSLIFGLAAAIPVAAQEHKHDDAKHEPSKTEGAKPETATITGEVVDMGCYLGHEAKGAKHVECATKCINAGMPMGLLTSEGQLYLLTMNHDNPDPYNELKALAGQSVAITGMVMERAEMKGIDVASFKPAPAEPVK